MTIQEIIEKVPELSLEERRLFLHVLVDSIVDEVKMQADFKVSETHRNKGSNEH